MAVECCRQYFIRPEKPKRPSKDKVFNKEFLKQESGRYKGYPLRTHAGGVYKNGYSDHFPVYLYLIKEVK